MVMIIIVLWLFFLTPLKSYCSSYHFLSNLSKGSLTAIDPDITIRRIDPQAPDKIWMFGESYGFPPLYNRIEVPGLYQRDDFFYPFGLREESTFQSRLRFSIFFESRWSKKDPFDGHSRLLTAFQGRSDLGQEYWGVFPFYGYTYRRFGVDSNFFCLFPLYYRSRDDDAITHRYLWPFITYANSPGRKALKVWPIAGSDSIRNDYFNRFVLWPLFQNIEKYPGTPQASSYLAAPFPLYVKECTPHDKSTSILWPFLNYYKHKSGHTRYSLWPFIKYGSGGGLKDVNLFHIYSYKKDLRTGEEESGRKSGRIDIADDEIYTERKFALVNAIQKRYKDGCLIFARYRFWPFAEYTWEKDKGTHLKIPAVITLKNDWFNLNLGSLLNIINIRETPISTETSFLFGLSRNSYEKRAPHIPPGPRPGEDSFEELILGAFGER
jgi:hypothetical protein